MPELPDRLRQFYAEAALPDDVVARLAATGRQARRQRLLAWGGLAAAAAVAFSVWCGVSRTGPRMTVEALDEQVSAFFSRPDARLDFASSDPSEVRKWLETRKGPSDFKVPVGLAGKATVGCEILGVGDQRVFIICFLESESRIEATDTTAPKTTPTIVHLVLAPKGLLAVVPPPAPQPRFAMHKGWAFATWSFGEQVYLLTTDAGFEPIRRALKA